MSASDADGLRRELDKPIRREQLEETEHLRLSNVLYMLAKHQSPAVYHRFVAPAEERRGNGRVYLKPPAFAELVATDRDLLETGGEISPNQSTESLLLMGYAYALLQRSVAELVLAPLRELGPGARAWLDVTVRHPAATAPRPDRAAEASEPPRQQDKDHAAAADGSQEETKLEASVLGNPSKDDPCTDEYVNELEQRAAALINRTGSLQEDILRLDAAAVSPADLHAQLDAMAAERAAMEVLVSAFSRCPTDCPGRELGCAPLRSAAGHEHLQVRDARGLGDTLLTMRSAHLDVESAARRDVNEANTIRRALAERSADEPPKPTSLRAARLLQLASAEALDAVRSRYAERLEAQRRSVLEAATALHQQAGSDPSRVALLDGLVDSAHTASDLDRLEALAARLAELAEAWAPRRSAADVAHALACQEDPPKLDDLTELAEALADRPLVGAILLWLVQRSEPIDLLVDGDIRRFWQAWLSTFGHGCLECGSRAVSVALGLALDALWLRDTTIEDVPRIEQHAIRALLLALARHEPSLIAVASRFDVFEQADTWGSTLGHLATLLRDRRSFQLVNRTVLEERAEAELQVGRALGAPLQSIVMKAGRLTDSVAEVREAVQDAWTGLRATPRVPLATSWKAVDHGLEQIDHEWLRKRAIAECQEIRHTIECWLVADDRVRLQSVDELSAARLAEDLAELRSRGGSSDIWDLTERVLFAPEVVRIDIATEVLTSASVIRAAPRLAVAIASDARWVPTRNAVRALVEGLATAVTDEDAVELLRASDCYDSAAAIMPSLTTEMAERAEGQRMRAEEEVGKLNEAEREELTPALAGRRWPRVRRLVDDALRRHEESERSYEAQARTHLTSELRAQRRRFRELEDRIEERTFDVAWRHAFKRLLNQISDGLADALAPERTAREKGTALTVLQGAIGVAEDIVREESQDIEPLRAALAGLGPGAAASSDERDAVPDLSLVTMHRETRQMTWDHLQALVASAENVGLVDSFMRSLAKLSSCYCAEDEHYTLKSVAGSAIPFAETSFTKPGGSFFETPLRLYFVPTGKRRADEERALRGRLQEETARGFHHVVCVPGDATSTREALDAPIREGSTTVLDGDALRKMLEAPTPGLPLRQLMRRSVSVDSATPFKDEGYVSQDNHIYVPRKRLLQQLTDGRSWVVWGGRRSGKTSLLHDVVVKMKHRRSGRMRAAYVSMEALAATGVSGLDDAAAREIGRALRWTQRPESLEDFAEQLGNEIRQIPTCIVIDETDAYIKPHLDEGSRAFRLIRALRALSNRDSKQLVCIFAGFKQLFRAVRIERHNDDSAYPWQNWLHTADPVGWFTPEETAAIVREGFEELLGMQIEAGVPLNIQKHTGGHPASVQHFANCILKDIAASVRQDPARRITVDDVARTYERPTFIRFVESTLAMNLGELERIIAYVMAAVSLAPPASPGDAVPRSRVQSDVNYFFGNVGAPSPPQEEFDHAFLNLEMTGMLRIRDAKVEMRHASYADILTRLEEITRSQTEIVELVRRYSLERRRYTS